MLLLLLGIGSCRSTEPAPVDGTFSAVLSQKNARQRITGSARFWKSGWSGGIPPRIGLELIRPFPDATADGVVWGMGVVFPVDLPPAAGAVYTLQHSISASTTTGLLLETRRVRGENLGHQWSVTSGEVHVESATASLVTGTFSFNAESTFGIDEPMRVTVSFRATCPGDVPAPCL